ncbi:hypothetical protein [Nocardia aurantia]|nr:hypothetical protein [Nocardia aurantia]
MPTVPGPEAVALDRATVGAPRTFFDCVLVHIVAEDDDRRLAAAAARRVRDLAGDTGYLLVTGSCAAPSDGTRFRDGFGLVAEIAERLEEHGEQVHLLPFGWMFEYEGEPLPVCWEEQVSAGAGAFRRRTAEAVG